MDLETVRNNRMRTSSFSCTVLVDNRPCWRESHRGSTLALRYTHMPSQFSKYRPYVRGLVSLATDPALADRKQWKENVEIALNGQAGDQLKVLVAVETRRKHGTFFTGHELAEKLLHRAGSRAKLKDAVWLDPTVGGADLLIATAKLIGGAKDYERTIERWGEVLLGLDQQQEFIEASKARLVLLARSVSNQYGEQPVDWNKVFPNICRGDSLSELDMYERATHLVMNPPFSKMDAPEDCAWAKGKVNAAAVFIETAVKNARPGAKILAILPEVLRTGTSYTRWQKEITKHSDVVSAASEGLFHNADVDVFSLVLKKKAKSTFAGKGFPIARKEKEQRLGDLFKVSVGAVVPYRDPKQGPNYRYLHPKNATAWGTLRRAKEWRKFSGTVFTPPFVVIRRTSRPGDKHRATASLVLGRTQVAVENHLIVCKPNDGEVPSCEHLMHTLRSSTVDAFINAEMRCRHLTTSIVRAIPIE